MDYSLGFVLDFRVLASHVTKCLSTSKYNVTKKPAAIDQITAILKYRVSQEEPAKCFVG